MLNILSCTCWTSVCLLGKMSILTFTYFFSFFLNFTLFYFTILYWFCHTSTWIRHRCTWVPNPEPHSHLPPYTISLGHPSAPAPSILYPASNLAWLSSIGISHHSLLPHFPSVRLSTVNSSPRLGIPHKPWTPAPSHCAFEGTCFPVQGMYDCGKDCLILIPCRLPQISCFTLSLKCFSSDSDNCPIVEIGPLLQFPTAKGRSNPTNTPVLHPSSFILPSCAWVYMFFSADEVLLSTLSWSSACTSVSEGIFLMYPWREMYFTSTYSSIIFFSPQIMSRSLS